MSAQARPVLLVLAPAPLFPVSAGNRRRLLATCDFLKECGYDLDFAYVAHEDQVYRRFGHSPPTDIEAMSTYFRRLWLVELERPIRLRTQAEHFLLDDWAPEEADRFVSWYFAETPEARGVIVNYVFLSKCLEAAPRGTLRVIDTHDRFAERKSHYLPFRSEANFFHTDEAGEGRGLSRADIVIAIQPDERAAFERLVEKPVFLLPPEVARRRAFVAPTRARAIGFLGHGNDANLVSIRRFAADWIAQQTAAAPKLVIAGEICSALDQKSFPGVELMGYVDSLDAFYDAVDIVVAPMLFGTGLKLKVVEALAHGKPVIGTSEAFAGMPEAPKGCRLPIDSLARHVAMICDDASALAAATKECESAFHAYEREARIAAKRLRARLAESVPPGPRDTTKRAVPSEDTPAIVRRYGATVISERSTTKSDASEILVATEFRPAETNAGRFDPAVFDPQRRSWHMRAARFDDPPAQDETQASPMAGRRLCLAPLLMCGDASGEDETIACWAAHAISAAEPDWACQGAVIGHTAGDITLAFSGPSFLFARGETVAAFAIPRRASPAFRLERACFAPRFTEFAPPISISRRCDGSAFLPLAMRVPAKSTDELEALIIVCGGLWGRVALGRRRAEPRQ